MTADTLIHSVAAIAQLDLPSFASTTSHADTGYERVGARVLARVPCSRSSERTL